MIFLFSFETKEARTTLITAMASKIPTVNNNTLGIIFRPFESKIISIIDFSISATNAFKIEYIQVSGGTNTVMKINLSFDIL